MILVDTSIWIDHLRSGEPRLAALLHDGQVLTHPWVVGEIALGRLQRRSETLGLLDNLPGADVATDSEVRRLIEVEQLGGRGIGYVDAHLLAATRLTVGARLWSRDRRLTAVAVQLGVAGPDRPVQ